VKIYSMTATFGKLEHQTLTLEPGLNIIEAPNEWGKSTWCAFLINMLYGFETRERTTKTALADKDRYAPWSGAPMSGSIDLNWNGRDITIQRQTKGRLIFGDFSAFETATGIPVPELNGANCGQMLLGVERSVFTQAGFLKQSDLPVVPNDALRRRLNNLVTTGDETGAGDKLADKLKELKNKCRYNRTGLLPQAEDQARQLEGQLSELEQLAQQANELQQRQKLLEKQISLLDNHKAALSYADAKADAEKVETARLAAEQAQNDLNAQDALCKTLPPREEVRQSLANCSALQEKWMALQKEPLPAEPQAPEIPERYQNSADILAAAQNDLAAYQKLTAQMKKKNTARKATAAAGLAIAVVEAILALLLQVDLLFILAALVLLATIGIVIGISAGIAKVSKKVKELEVRRAPLPPELWVSDAQAHCQKHAEHQQALQNYRDALQAHQEKKAALDAQIAALTGGQPLSQAAGAWNQALNQWDHRDQAARELHQAQNRLELCRAMAKSAQPPKFTDMLTFSAQETEERLAAANFELKQLPHKLGQNQGRAEALGQEATIRSQLKAVNRRIAHLEDVYNAVELAQRALSAASTELQRRFAPRIAKRAQELFARLTGGRYDRFVLTEDLSIDTKTTDEVGVRKSHVRSDGTIDQLYLALRLAVAEELTPDAPLVLDDALVRFDDIRAAVAVDILRQTGETKQVILFTCQSREKNL